jgi:hypothetical protein
MGVRVHVMGVMVQELLTQRKPGHYQSRTRRVRVISCPNKRYETYRGATSKKTASEDAGSACRAHIPLHPPPFPSLLPGLRAGLKRKLKS